MTDVSAPGATPGLLRVCVFCGARHGTDPRHTQAAEALGRAIGERGLGLVYGGGHVGLMGVVADAALKAGADVLGIIPERLRDKELGHGGVQTLRAVPDMHTRKRQMAEAAGIFIALPGGIGTLEELFEIWTWRQLGYHGRPIGLLNTAGFYDPLQAFLAQVRDQGFVEAHTLAVLEVGTEPADLLDKLLAERLAQGQGGGHDLRTT